MTSDDQIVEDCSELEDQECLQQEKRQKRLAQLVVARQKAAEVKKRRAAPKKELKRLQEEIKERLYQEDLQRVKTLRDLHANAPKVPPKTVKPESTPFAQALPRRSPLNHLDDLVNILYS